MAGGGEGLNLGDLRGGGGHHLAGQIAPEEGCEIADGIRLDRVARQERHGFGAGETAIADGVIGGAERAVAVHVEPGLDARIGPQGEAVRIVEAARL